MFPFRVARGLLRTTTGKRWSFDHDPILARRYGRHFEDLIVEVRPDLVFAPAASACVAFLETDVPIVYFTDGPWRAVHDYLPVYANSIGRTLRGGEEFERRTLDRAGVILVSSEWAAESVIHDYGVDPAKVHVVYIGANLLAPPSREQVLPRALGAKLRLLMVGVHWENKGGPIAYDALLHLLEWGYDAELTVVGCRVPASLPSSAASDHSFP